MKKLTSLLVLSAIVLQSIVLISCSATKNNAASNSNPVFLITKVQPEKDGQTLFLKNEKGETFTTVISYPNGNFIKVNEGDKVSVEIEEILKMDPPVIISKKIQIVEK